MADVATWNVEWPNVNASRKYPLAESATMQDTSGSFTLPNNLIVDFVLSVNVDKEPALDPALFHVGQVAVFSAGVVLGFAYNNEVFATVNVPVVDFTKYSTYRVSGVGLFPESSGFVTIGSLEETLRSGGAWTFDVDGGRLHPMTLRPGLRGVTSLVVVDAVGESAPMSGDIAFVAGPNFQFRVERKEDFNRDRDRIIFSALSTDGFEEECVCDNVDVSSPCIRTINGVSPNQVGAIELLPGSTCLQISPNAQYHAISIRDICSEPCCDCDELEVVMSALRELTAQLSEIDRASLQLRREFNTTRTNLLAIL